MGLAWRTERAMVDESIDQHIISSSVLPPVTIDDEKFLALSGDSDSALLPRTLVRRQRLRL